jgi:small neutral amino acid transporter SnatA (MarC family)
MFDFALTAVASTLFVVDPVGALPAYLAMTEGDDPAKRRRTAWLASLVATLTGGLSDPITTLVTQDFQISEDNGWPNVEGHATLGLRPCAG